MTASEIISITAIALSFATSFLALYFTRRSMKVNFKSSSARTEITIRNAINLALQYMDDKIIAEEKDPTQLNHRILTDAVLRVANLYDDVCGLYLRAKIDRSSFFFSYKDEIIQVIKMLETDYPKHKDKFPRLKLVYEISQTPEVINAEIPHVDK